MSYEYTRVLTYQSGLISHLLLTSKRHGRRRRGGEKGGKKSAALAGVGGGSARVHHSSAVPASVCVCDRHITTETKTKRDEKQDGESGRRYLARGTRASYARVNGSGAWRKPREKKERKKKTEGVVVVSRLASLFPTAVHVTFDIHCGLTRS